MAIKSLWPDDITERTDFLMPVTILREQAAVLARKTMGVVVGSVATLSGSGTGDFTFVFTLLAPVLDSYEYPLFEVSHGVEGYPGVVKALRPKPYEHSFTDQESFEKILSYLFESKETRTAVQALVAQSVTP